jgi:hypothetical protein
MRSEGSRGRVQRLIWQDSGAVLDAEGQGNQGKEYLPATDGTPHAAEEDVWKTKARGSNLR